MSKEFQQIGWTPELEADWRHLLALAVREDLDRMYDWTTISLVPERALGQAAIIARQDGVVAGLAAAQIALAQFDSAAKWMPSVVDGDRVTRGDRLAMLSGSARALLTAERTMLNVLGRLSGIATLTARFVDAVAGTKARIYDTRKTTAGWRRLEKYAVRMGGGFNHRLGLFDAILIKDNHLALGSIASDGSQFGPADAVRRAREFAVGLKQAGGARWPDVPIIEIEIDSLDQLDQVLSTGPDIILLDNLPPETLREAVLRRDQLNVPTELEASGGITLATVGAIAAAGVDRISIGALTHSAPALDVGLDWKSERTHTLRSD